MSKTLRVVHHGSTLCLNRSHHESIPEGGLELPAGAVVEVPAVLLPFLKTLPAVEVLPAPIVKE